MTLLASACSHHTVVRPILKGGPADAYLTAFVAAESVYPGGAREGSRAPDGDAEVLLKDELGVPLIGDGCHSVWLKSPAGQRRILTVREADPGSGSSFGFAWSRDGRAVFIFGGHSGLDCRGPVLPERLRIIYTVADGTAWTVVG